MRLPLLAFLPVLLAPLGCAGNVSGGGDAEVATTTSAVVVIERAIDAKVGARAEGSARFVRITASGSVDDALRTIGASLELPLRGACASVASLGGRMARGGGAPVVQLVDVGTVSIEANGIGTRLLPRQLPDVTDVVSGVVYARAAEPALLPAAARYSIHVAGGSDLPPFDVTASAPVDPSTIQITGDDNRGTVIATGSTLNLTWAADASDDVVYLDVRPSGVRCVFGNTGQAVLSTVLLDDAGTLVVHRLHREPLRAVGIDSGEIRFDFARSVAYVRR